MLIQARKIENIQKGYLNGKYGAIPFNCNLYSSEL